MDLGSRRIMLVAMGTSAEERSPVRGCIGVLGLSNQLPSTILGSLKQERFILSQFWRIEVWNQGDHKGGSF